MQKGASEFLDISFGIPQAVTSVSKSIFSLTGTVCSSHILSCSVAGTRNEIRRVGVVVLEFLHLALILFVLATRRCKTCYRRLCYVCGTIGWPKVRDTKDTEPYLYPKAKPRGQSA